MLNNSHIESTPKHFVDSSLQGFGKEFIILLLGSGQSVHGFAISPIHFKQIYQGMAKTIESFEAAHGLIEVKDEPILSPIQIGNNGKI